MADTAMATVATMIMVAMEVMVMTAMVIMLIVINEMDDLSTIWIYKQSFNENNNWLRLIFSSFERKVSYL